MVEWGFWMFMDFIQTVIPRQQSTKKARERSAKQPSETIRTAMADTQPDADAAIVQKNPQQLRPV
jgi:hypothetical protein